MKGPNESSWNNHWRGTDRPTMRFKLFGITPETGQWRWERSRTYDAVENYQTLVNYIKAKGLTENEITDTDIDVYYSGYLQENSILRHRDFELVRLSKNGKPEHYIPATDIILLSENWTDINVVGNQSDFSHEKNEEILKRILEWLTEKEDIILDFFAGAGTAGAVAHKLDRQWILVEQMDYIETLTIQRLNGVISGEQSSIFKTGNWHGDRDFIYCELMPYNEVFMKRIQSAQSSEELLDIWRDMSKDSVLNWYVKPQKPEEAEEHFIAINDVEKQKQLLAELLDKNQLYVHLSEIEDETFAVSEADEALNRAFYGDSN